MSHIHLGLIFASKTVATHMALLIEDPALPATIRLSQKQITMTNSLAYSGKEFITFSASHFPPVLIFAGKDSSLPLGRSPVIGLHSGRL
jgi:hypothetical protein